MDSCFLTRIASHGFILRKNVEGKSSVCYPAAPRQLCTRAYKEEEDQMIGSRGDGKRDAPLQLNQSLIDASNLSLSQREVAVDSADQNEREARVNLERWDSKSQETDYTASLSDGLKFVAEAEMDIEKQNELEDVLDELEMRKGEASGGSKSKKWGEAKKKDRLNALTEMEIIEDSPDRAAYNRSLFAAAKKGRPDMAEAVIEEMLTAGVMPGPKAHHAVVFAYVKAGDADSALTAIRRTHNSGVMPITESYLVLIHAFVKENNLKTAEAILASMRRAGADGQQGWLVMIRSLLDIGDLKTAKEHLKMGESHNWKPDSRLYEALMQEVCNSGKQRQAAQLLKEIQAEGIPLTIKHVNPFLDLMSKNEKSSLATIKKTRNLVNNPDVTTFNAVLRAHLYKWDGSNNEEGAFMGVWMHLLDACTPNTTSMVLMVRAQMNMGNLQEAVRLFLDNKVGQAQGYARTELMELVLPDMLSGLSEEGQPVDILRVLQSLELDTCTVPDTIMKVNITGNTFATAWLARRLTKLKEALQTSDGSTAPVMEMGSRLFRYGEYGVLLGFCNCVVEDDGTIKPVSKLNVVQMAAELESRGVSCEGLNRTELMAEIRASRSAWPAITEEIKRKRRLKHKKGKMEKEAAYDPELMGALGPMGQYDTEIAGSMVVYGYGGESKRTHLSEEDTLERLEDAIARVEALNAAQDKFRAKKEKEAAGDSANSAKSDDAEDDANASSVGKTASTETTGNDEEDGEDGDLEGEKETDGSTSTEGIDEIESMSKEERNIDVWQDSMDLASSFESTSFGNSTAGVVVAVKIAEVVYKLGQMLTLEDFETLVSGVVREKSPASGFVLGKMMAKLATGDPLPSMLWDTPVPKQEKDIMYKERISDALTTCARTCLEEGYPDSALQIVNCMIDSKITPPPILISKIKQQQANPSKQPILDGLSDSGTEALIPAIDEPPEPLLLDGEQTQVEN